MKSSLTHLIIAVVVLIGAIGGYLMWYMTVAGEEQQVATLSDSTVSARLNAQRLTAAQTALADVASTETLVEGYFVSDVTIAQFLSELQARGKSAGATVTVQSVSADAQGHSLTIILGITGTFDAVMRAEGALEYAPYDLANRGFSITQASDTATSTWNGNATFSVGTALALAPRPATTTAPKP